MCQGLPPVSLGSAQGRANCSLCVSPHAPPFLMPVWITFRPVPSQAPPEVWLPRLLGPGNPGALAVWRPRPGRSHSRQLSNSGCLGSGRPIDPGESPGIGCSFLPRPRAHPAPQHTDSAVLGCTGSFHRFLRSTLVCQALLPMLRIQQATGGRTPCSDGTSTVAEGTDECTIPEL